MGDRDTLLAELDALVIGALDSLLFRLDIESLKKNGARISGFPDFESLTDRQRAILDMLVDGKTNREISRSLCVSESLVKQENMTIFKALGTRNRHETSRIARLRTLHADAPPPARGSTSYPDVAGGVASRTSRGTGLKLLW